MTRLYASSVWAAAIVVTCIGTASHAHADTPTPSATTQGGSHQIGALEGCLNQWLFNGVWRVRVTSVQPITDPVSNVPGYALNIEIKNGSTKTAVINETGVAGPGHLVLDDGNQLDATSGNATVAWNNAQFKELTASAGLTTSTQYFFAYPAPKTPGKPVKWLWDIDKSKEWTGQPRYSASDPSMRVDLTCDKSGT
jgi:hypothetical protein